MRIRRNTTGGLGSTWAIDKVEEQRIKTPSNKKAFLIFDNASETKAIVRGATLLRYAATLNGDGVTRPLEQLRGLTA
ncbi:MAG: hypothetical protein ACLS89_04665 [Collinsella sp.]